MTRTEVITRRLDVNGGPAVCRSQNFPDRAVAGRLIVGHAYVSPDVHEAGATALLSMDSAIGRVVGLGQFVNMPLAAALSRHIGGGLTVSPRFEWYACRGAGYHNDAHYGGVLFGAWCISGPRRDIVFPRLGMRVAAGVHDFVVFDPFEPHAVLNPDCDVYVREHYLEAEPNLFLGFEIEVTEVTRSYFAIGGIANNALELSSRIPINPETGAFP